MTAHSLDPEAKMAAFARTFPSVVKATGVTPWDANALDQWAADAPISHGELVTARLLLAVWDSAMLWRCGQFNLMEALPVWDDRHRAAFVAWASDPWWP